jgi:cyclophilin family peptidyl-prolyl cis-trans isomerase
LAVDAPDKGWKSGLLGLVKKYGSAARFAATTVLNALLPGAPAVVALVEKAFDAAGDAAQDQWERQLERSARANAAELGRLNELLGLLAGGLEPLMTQVAALEGMPEAAERIIRTTLATDAGVRAALARLEDVAGRFDRLEEQNRRLLDGQDEMLALLRRTLGLAAFVEELRGAGLDAPAARDLIGQRQRGLAALAAGKAGEAEPALRQVAEARPGSAAAQEALASAAVVARRTAEAGRALTRAVRLRPDDAELSQLQRRVTRAAGVGDTPPAAAGGPASGGLAVGDVLDGWRVEEHLGGGGWGLVFRASREGQTRALKAMRPELARDPAFVERFKREIGALYGLPRHPALVRIDTFGYGADAGCWYLVMEHVEGQTLEAYLGGRGPLTPEAAVGLFAALADGLAEAHRRGIVHRDIKPSNVLLRRPGGGPVLIDFGLAAAADAVLTRGATGHTPMFASPEQLRGRPADSRSDVWCLAGSLYYALAYADPAAREPGEYEPGRVPAFLRAVLDKGLAQRPADRYADAAAFGEALRGAGGPGPTRPKPAEPPAAKPPSSTAPASFSCPRCRAVLKSAGPLAAGKKVRCPRCGTAFLPGGRHGNVAGDSQQVIMETSLGTVKLELDGNKAPLTVANFLSYVDEHFYDGTIFHRVSSTFMIQGGGFEPGMSQKRTKAAIKNESPNGLSNTRGTIAVARPSDPDSATAQFYINVADNSDHLDRQRYCVFGKVIEGMDVVDKITVVPITSRGEYRHVPIKDVVIHSITRA